jgi:DNA-binding SARP family transcriptional activator/Flp pilus assembly protein TadD
MAVEFRLLGDVETRVDGSPIVIGYAQLRCVLAILLVEANRTVPVDHMVDRVWTDRRLPARPRGAVQHTIAVLRKALTAVPEVTISWRSSGYQLDVDPETVDLHRFHALIGQARAAADDDRTAALYEQALRLWHGEPFAGLSTGWLAGVRTRLIQQRNATRLDLTDIRLRRGAHATLLAELRDWTEHDPLDERLAGQYLLALYRSGRQAQALEHYERTRRLLAEQLGADPSPPLRRLHTQILTGDPALRVPAASARHPAPRVVPRQLPARPRLFTGRRRELADLTAALTEPGSVVISAIGGAGGVGKTWLALYWAYQHLDRFPDGQLHANLRGFDPVEEPTPASAAVRGFLEALGVDPAAVPVDTDAAAALYRSLVAGKRMLVVLDNARDTAQVEPLLPGGSSGTVLVTSRHRLTGLVTRHGARAVDLDVLTRAEGRDLLTGHLGTGRVAAEPGAVAELLSRCAGLPLAISIVAARAIAHPGFPLAALAGELRDRPGQLDALDGGDPTTNLRAVLSCSYRALFTRAAAVFVLLGLAPGPDIGEPAAASLAGLSLVDARNTLRELEKAYLVKEHRPGRFRMHDLIRSYATELAGRDPAAQRRLVDFYLHTSLGGARLLDPYRRLYHPGEPAPGVHVQAHPDEAAALAWFAAEHANLVAVQQVAADQGWHSVVWQLPWNLETFHWRRGLLDIAVALWRAGLAAADALADPVAQTIAHQRLGNASAPLGRHDEALHHLRLALTIAEHTGDALHQAHAHLTLAWAHEERGDQRRALEHAVQAARLFHGVGEPSHEANALNTVGWYHALLGEYEEARTHGEAALLLLARQPDRQSQAATLDTLGYVAHQTGEHDRAWDYYRQALDLFRELGFAYEEANTLEHLGQTLYALGRVDEARDTWRRALELYQAQHRTAQAERLRKELAGSW